MSAKTQRMQRRRKQGAVIDFDSSLELKPGQVTIDGQRFSEAVDGRIVRMPTPKLDFSIQNGRIVRF